MRTHLTASLPRRLRQAARYAVGVWLVGFAWSMIVFAIPALRWMPSVPGVSKFPAVSVVLLPSYVVLLTLLTRRYLQHTPPEQRQDEGLRLGTFFLLANTALDVLVYVGIFCGVDYFAYASIWVADALLVGLPYALGASAARRHDQRSAA